MDPNGVRVATVEHLMSALAGLGIDNLIVEMTGPETPIMDGSAAPFIYLLDSAGISEQTALKRYIRVLKPLEVVEGDKWVKLTRMTAFTVSLEIEFNHPVFRRTPQHLTIDFAAQSYIDEVSRARTFGFMHEVEYMRMNGLGLGGNLDNAIVIDDDSVLNKDGLRFNNEFVRHKILDAIGDLYMIGHPLIAAFSGFKSGHAMNKQAAARIAGAAGRLGIRHLPPPQRRAVQLPSSAPSRLSGFPPVCRRRFADGLIDCKERPCRH